MKMSVYRSMLVWISLVFGIVTSGSINASTLGGWWDGTWACNIDGRSARMKWNIVDAGETNCYEDGGERICTTTSAVAWRGRFSDNNSRWVPLTNPRLGSKGGLYFNHADGNRWYLAKPVGGKTVGWTTWNGNRYHLSCWR